MKLEEAIRRPFNDLTALLIGIIITIIPIVNVTIGTGYILKAAKLSMRRNYSMPKWENWSGLFVHGLTIAVISFLYFIPMLIISTVFLGLSMFSFMAGMMTGLSGMMVGLASLGISLIIFLIIFLFTIYVLPIALMNYIDKEEFKEAFNFSLIWKKTSNKEYFSAWLPGFAYSFIANAILLLIPIIGPAIALFITSITFFTLISEVYPRL